MVATMEATKAGTKPAHEESDKAHAEHKERKCLRKEAKCAAKLLKNGDKNGHAKASEEPRERMSDSAY